MICASVRCLSGLWGKSDFSIVCRGYLRIMLKVTRGSAGAPNETAATSQLSGGGPLADNTLDGTNYLTWLDQLFINSESRILPISD